MDGSLCITAITSITRKRDIPPARVTQRKRPEPDLPREVLRATRGGGITKKVVMAVMAVMKRREAEEGAGS